MATFSSFEAWHRALAGTIDDAAMARVGRKAGGAGKDASLTEITRALGGDRAMSNFRGGKPRVNAGWDLRSPTVVDVNIRPKGMAILADMGRRGSGVIDTDYFQAVNTPWGPKAYSRWGPSKGTGMVRKAEKRMTDDVPKAAARAFEAELRRGMG